ncbi:MULTISPECIES: FxsA family protein [Bacillaceae]|uniref:FxsA family protein n=1 Tax=Bacillaceae TaxID=186817 RepID=UPI0005A449EB|nr:FxsA family protein [Caldibacillus thermoamylovorans]KIO65001.1 hypothetical protein B4065_0273 [Caldibacillus thermoamylovorans]NWN95965.1 membrane protein FxsA [Bacillus sp. (in: firmicutes)]
MRFFILVFVILPALEIGVFLLSGKTIGVWNTVLIIIFTGILGAFLTKRQGLEVMRKAQDAVRAGYPPDDVLLDGICIFLGGSLLISPGFITDCLGLILLLPPTRKLIKPLLIKWFQRWIDKRTIYID